MPPRKHRIIGTILSTLVARAPWLWPLLRRPTQNFWNKMASQWTGRAAPDRAAALEAGARRVPGAPQRILEVGSGSGDGTAALARVFPGARITGMDLSQEMVRAAEQANPGPEYVVGDAAELPFDDDTFDLVAQNNVPFYPRELKRVLKPGGHVLVASTLGPSTPYYTPHSFLRRKLAEVDSGQEGRGDWFIGTSA
jgi:ubiquinone/menaquinone biosynthesis C-methylase UbiE